MANPCLQPKLSDFCGYPFEVYEETKTEFFYRNNCPSGQSGSGVSYSKNYVSNVSEEHLQQLIIADEATFNAEGQANANSQGICSASCTPKTTTSMSYMMTALNSSIVYFRGQGAAGQNIPEPALGTFSVPRSLLLSGTGSIPSQTFIHNLSTRTRFPNGGNLGYRMVLNSGNTYDYLYGIDSSKCSETVIATNLPAPTEDDTMLLFDYKTIYAGPSSAQNGLYYLHMTHASRLGVYFLPEGSTSAYLVGNCDAPTASAGSKYGYWSPSSGMTRAFITMNGQGVINIVAYARRYNSGLTSFDNNRTRTMIWRVDSTPFEGPISVTEIFHQYNNDRLRIDAVSNWGSNNIAVFYRLTRGSDSHGVLSYPNNLPSPGLVRRETVLSAVGDANNIFLMVERPGGTSIRYYSVSSNTWANGRLNI